MLNNDFVFLNKLLFGVGCACVGVFSKLRFESFANQKIADARCFDEAQRKSQAKPTHNNGARQNLAYARCFDEAQHKSQAQPTLNNSARQNLADARCFDEAQHKSQAQPTLNINFYSVISSNFT